MIIDRESLMITMMLMKSRSRISKIIRTPEWTKLAILSKVKHWKSGDYLKHKNGDIARIHRIDRYNNVRVMAEYPKNRYTAIIEVDPLQMTKVVGKELTMVLLKS